MDNQTQGLNMSEWPLAANSSFNSSDDFPLPVEMTFNAGHIVSIVAYSILMLIAAVGNLTVLAILIKRQRHIRSRINTMMMHLAIADLLVTFLLMPLEIGWAATVSWEGGDALCRIMAFFRTFGLYLSSFVLICISIDRYYAVLKPLSLCHFDSRGRFMLTTAWIASILCSVPQMLVFHVAKHPRYKSYEQCVVFDSFPNETWELVYKYFGLIMMYLLPLLVIIFSYTSILMKIYRKCHESDDEGNWFRRSSAGFFGRAKIRTLKMTITIVVVFIVCWTPYYVMCLWYWYDNESANNVDQRIQKALFLFASANSCMNPIVYGLFNIRTGARKNERRSWKRRDVRQAFTWRHDPDTGTEKIIFCRRSRHPPSIDRHVIRHDDEVTIVELPRSRRTGYL